MNTVKVKTYDLTEIALDWVAGKCEGLVDESIPRFPANTEYTFRPSTNWAQCGPIIHREKITTSDCEGGWFAGYNGTLSSYGKTPMEAAMRCYVRHVLGDEVDIPADLARK